MKSSIFTLFICTIFILASCGKSDLLKDKDAKKDYDKKEKEVDFCTWDGSLVSDPALWNKYVTIPTFHDEDCGCITSGEVKYVEKNGYQVYIVHYGKGECDNIAYLEKTSCPTGECKDKKTEKCAFELDCTPSGK